MDILEELGFTQYENKIIISLLKLSKATASQISKTSKVPQNKVYQTITELAKKGLIIEISDKPKTYTLNNIKKYIQNEIKKKQESVFNLENEYEKFIANTQTPMQSEDFWILNGLDALLTKIEETYKNLEKESIAVIEFWASRYSTLKVSKQAIKKGKKIRFLGNVNKESLPHVKRWLQIGIEIKHNPNIKKAGFAVFDNKYTKISLKGQQFKSIWSENENLAEILQEYYETLWEKSEKVTLENIEKFNK